MKRGETWLATLDPTVGSEIRKTRPCVVVSPPEMHDQLRTVIVAPMSTRSRAAPFRPPIMFAGKRGFVVLDLFRALDKSRLVKRLGKSTPSTIASVLGALRAVFAE